MSTAVPPLEELQAWERCDWEEYEPCLWRGDPSPKRVVETIIQAADRELSWQGERDANSLRDFWYNPTKPILQRAFPMKLEREDYDFNRLMSQYLSEKLSEMVKAGDLTYRSLNILDESRDRKIHLDSPDAGKILFVEKDAAYRKVRPLEDVYELSIVSGGGWQATALIEDLAYELDETRSYTVYLLTDYDPTGWQIGRDFSERASQLGLDIDAIRRVGIHPQQLPDETIAQQRFEPAVDSDADRTWMDTYGIHGRYGLEIEALGGLNSKGEALRRLVVEELRDDINTQQRRARDVEEKTRSAILEAREEVVGEITAELHHAIETAIVEVLDEKDGVGIAKRRDTLEVSTDLLIAEDGREWLPRPYEADELHAGAINDKRPKPAQRHVVEYLKQEVSGQIQRGEIDLSEHLDLESGSI